MERKGKKAKGLYSNCITLLSKVSLALFLRQKIALGVLSRAEGNISSVGQERGPFIRGKIRRELSV